MNEEPTYFDGVKRKLLNNKFISLAVLGFSATGAILACVMPLANYLRGSSPPGPISRPSLPYTSEPVRVLRDDPQDPLQEGTPEKDKATLFESAHEIASIPITNGKSSGFDARELHTKSQGHYYHRLTDGEIRRANDKGWSLRCKVRVKEGAAMAGVEFGPPYKRWDIWLYRRDGMLILGLPSYYSKNSDGTVVFEKEIPSDILANEEEYLDLALTFDVDRKVAELLVNGTPQQVDYHGWNDQAGDTYNDNKFGVFYGTWNYLASEGRADFKYISFNTK